MKDERRPLIGLDFFWEQADLDGSTEHPLERELLHQMDALERCRGMLADAQACGRDDMAAALLAQHDRQAALVRQIQAALRTRLTESLRRQTRD